MLFIGIIGKPTGSHSQLTSFATGLANVLRADAWVTDGNYSAVQDIVLARADTLIWLDYALTTIFKQLTPRTLHRVFLRQELWIGNRERFSTQFLSRDSLYMWALRTHKAKRERYTALMNDPAYTHLEFVRLCSPRDLKTWLELNSNMPNPTERFSDRVDQYVKYRPDYPRAVLGLLQTECGLTPRSVVADIGSGTGKLSELFLRNGNLVYGVEPNREMRAAGEHLSADSPTFVSVDGSAEATTLPDACADLVTAGQAFHWFDRERARPEFARILKPGGYIVLVWNERLTDTPFLEAYETLTQTYSTDYADVSHKNVGDEEIARFFAPETYRLASLENVQHFDFESLLGRAVSSSYMPTPQHERYPALVEALRGVFERFAEGSGVAFRYRTQVFYGCLTDADA